MGKRVLLLDTSFAARPIHDWLLDAGHETWVIGNRPSDPLALRNPKRYLNDSYSDIAAAQAHIDRLDITHVVPGCTDLSLETAHRLAVPGTKLDSIESHHHMVDKAHFRELCLKLNLPAPRVVSTHELPIDCKLIAKPVDSFSGRGITIFDGDDPKQAVKALELARSESRSNNAIMETFATGELYSYSAFIERQRVRDATIVQEFGSANPFAVDTSYVVTDFSIAGETSLRLAVEAIANELKLVDGLIHTQFIWDGEKTFLIEITRRCPGDLYSTLIETTRGVPYARNYASYFLGETFDFPCAPNVRHILRHTITANHESYEGIWPQPPMQLLEIHLLLGIGREPPPPNRIDRIGVAFSLFPTHEALKSSCSQYLRRSAYQTRSR